MSVYIQTDNSWIVSECNCLRLLSSRLGCKLTLSLHSHRKTFPQPTELAAISVVLVDDAVLFAAAAVRQVLSHAPFEKTFTPLTTDCSVMTSWSQTKLVRVFESGCVKMNILFGLTPGCINQNKTQSIIFAGNITLSFSTWSLVPTHHTVLYRLRSAQVPRLP